VIATSDGLSGEQVTEGADPDPRWLDREERATWLSLLRLMAKLPPLLDAQLGRASGLNLFEYTILAMLSEQPDRSLRMQRLAAVTNSSPSKLSHAARHLEARGLLSRQADPEDGRCIRAVLTRSGFELVVGAAPGHVAAVRNLFLDSLTPGLLHGLRLANEQILERVDPDGSTHPDSRSDLVPDR
jgi:DNA-binding MarR family transcriptional regulator